MLWRKRSDPIVHCTLIVRLLSAGLVPITQLLRYELDTPEIFLKDVYITCWVKYDIVYIVTKAGQETRVRIFIGVMQTIGVIRGQMSL